MPDSQPVIFTIGHSTRPLAELIALLKQHGVTLLVDVRTVPRSRRNPQFNREALPGPLQAAGIGYRPMAELGGLRRPKKNSPNMGWRNESFRGYADHMQTPEFAAALDELMDLAQTERVVVMCAEAVPWRCHRSLIGDALLVRGVEVIDIISASSAEPHKLTPFARVEGTHITYRAPAAQEQPGLPFDEETP